MTASTRLRGKQGFFLTIKLGSAAAVSYADDVQKWELSFDDKDGDDLTFSEAKSGLGYDATLNLTALVSYDAGSLFAFLYDNAGAAVDIEVGPWGNATATATQPHFKGSANLGLPPGFSNEAAAGKDGNKGSDFETDIVFSTPLTKVTA